MEKLTGFAGAAIGSLVGWRLGAFGGLAAATVASMAGTGIGLWLGRRMARAWLES